MANATIYAVVKAENTLNTSIGTVSDSKGIVLEMLSSYIAFQSWGICRNIWVGLKRTHYGW